MSLITLNRLHKHCIMGGNVICPMGCLYLGNGSHTCLGLAEDRKIIIDHNWWL